MANNLDYYGAKIITALKILLKQVEEANTVYDFFFSSILRNNKLERLSMKDTLSKGNGRNMPMSEAL